MREADLRTGALRVQAEARLARARADGDDYREATALTELVEITQRLGDLWGLVTYSERAWDTAEHNNYWDLLARLAIVFGDVAYGVQDYQRCYDHYANACAFAVAAGAAEYRTVIARIDDILAELMATGRSAIAMDLSELLLAYEAEGGLGGADPAFAAHFRERLRQAEAQVRGDLLRVAARLN